jgi:2-desacetyl-2-hydroxyethyl bacteriochlorophyllide A dehydrogenase
MYEKSKAIVFERPKEVRLREVEFTPLQDDSIVCRTIMSGISSGTDMKTWRGQQHPEQVYFPLVPGYENAGEVVHLQPGAEGKGIKVGDRVMINECRRFGNACAAWGGGVEYSIKDSTTAPAPFDPVVKLPENVSYKDAVIAYLACVSLKGIKRIPLDSSKTVLVIGSGMVGVGAMQVLKIMYPGITVICQERHPFRRDIASKYADYTVPVDGHEVDKVKELTDGKGIDALIECSGNSSVVGGLYRYLKDGGWDDEHPAAHIHLQGDYPERIVFDAYQKWFGSNCTITMTCALAPGGKEQLLQWISEGKFDTDLPVEVWPVEKCAEAYAYKENKGEEVFKILFEWNA